VCGEEFSFMPEFKVDYAEESAEILAYDDENRPVMSKKKYGKGIVYYLGYNIEDMAAAKPGITGGNGIIPYYKFYELMKELKNNKKIVTKDNPFVGITEHIIDEETRLIVAVNCTLKENDVKFVFDGYRFSKILKNQGARIKETEEGAEIRFLPNSAVVFEIKSIS